MLELRYEGNDALIIAHVRPNLRKTHDTRSSDDSPSKINRTGLMSRSFRAELRTSQSKFSDTQILLRDRVISCRDPLHFVQDDNAKNAGSATSPMRSARETGKTG